SLFVTTSLTLAELLRELLVQGQSDTAFSAALNSQSPRPDAAERPTGGRSIMARPRSYGQAVLRRDEDAIDVKFLPAVAYPYAIIALVCTALISCNKLSPLVILLVAPGLRHPAAVAVKLGLKEVGRWYPE